jgi:Cu(I)/Ag(I) efflux system membrane fusion protein
MSPRATTMLAIAAVAVAAFLAGRACNGTPNASPAAAPAVPAAATAWTCSMHPQVRLPGPGNCPICFMALIPAQAGGGDSGGETNVVLSTAAKALAEVETAPVERRAVATEIRMVGKVEPDESRISTISAWVPGRLERLFVDTTGVPVQQGDHLLVLYSPELLTAQRELQQARRRLAETPDERFASLALSAAREKLRLLGLADAQIAEIEAGDAPSDRITIHAPTGGIVVQKNGIEGMYVAVGTSIYTIADLARVWVKLDAYESDLAWLRLGQTVTFEAEAHPGEPFTGRIGFIDPVLDERTRSVKVRVNVANEDGRLKPGMFVRAVVRATLGAGGVVEDTWLRDKWICPMHPDVVADAAGSCSECGMPLVTSESLGYARTPAEAEPPLIVPATAPLRTGTRALVYVEVEGAERPTYAPREVLLGPRAGEYVVVREGLESGERVVVNGNFKIDSALQLQGGPSMVSRTEEQEPAAAPGKIEPVELSEPARARLEALVASYLDLADRLAADDAAGARRAAQALRAALAGLNGLEAQDAANLRTGAERALEGDASIETLRRGFLTLSEALPDVLARYRPALAQDLHQFHCPMAFDDRGAAWYQRGELLANPYFGAAMLRCGSRVGVVAASAGAPPAEATPEARVVAAYLAMHDALAADDAAAASRAAREAGSLLFEEAASAGADLAALRAAFRELSESLDELQQDATLVRYRSASGAPWYQRGDTPRDPYLGGQRGSDGR